MENLGTYVSIALWGLSTTAGIVGSHWHLKTKIQHLEDTKEDKNGLGKEVAAISTNVALIKQNVEALDRKVSTLFTKIPCMQPGWKQEKCE